VFGLQITFLAGDPGNKERKTMLKKQGTLLFALMLTLLLTAVFAHQAPAQTKAAKEARWEGRVIRMDKAASSLTVRKAGGTLEKTCVYDSSTKWVSQYHADKKVTDIDAGQVKEDDYVICRGTAEKAGEIKATVISKRLSHSTNK
jgi:hypothetical protein